MHEGGFVLYMVIYVRYRRRRQDIVDIVFVDWDWAGLAKEAPVYMWRA